MSTKLSSHHIALDEQGYLLSGTPKRPARTMKNLSVFGNRFASGDRDYGDFSLWWFWAQTDWSGGIKDDLKWEDDAKYYYSTNIDAYSENGAIKLEKDIIADEVFPSNIWCAYYNQTAIGGYKYFVGIYHLDSPDNAAAIYGSSGDGNWTNITTNNVTTFYNFAYITKRGLYMWFLAENCSIGIVYTWNGTNFTDQTDNIRNNFGWSARCGKVAVEIGGSLYIALEDMSISSKICLVKTAVQNPSAAGDYTVLIDRSSEIGIIDGCEYDGNFYFLLYNGELRYYDITNSTENLVWRFNFAGSWSLKGATGGKFLHNLNGKLIITIPQKHIWQWDRTDMIRIWEKDNAKNTIGVEAVGYLDGGGILTPDNKIYWGNLIYDGENFYNWIKEIDDNTTNYLIPFMADKDNVIWGRSSYTATANYKTLYKQTTTYKDTEDKNFIIFNEVQDISTIDKIANNLKVVFKPLSSGNEIVVNYSIDGGINYTELGLVSYAVDGGSITQKSFYFGDNIIFRKMILKIYFNCGTTSSTTPTLLDIALQYLPFPDYRYQWGLSLNCNDEIKLTDGRTSINQKGIDLRNKLLTSFMKKEIIDFEDVDFHETQLKGTLAVSDTAITVDSTDGFPESGRFKIENEEIYYTGKSAFTFTGCTRSYRGTLAVAHADNTIVNNKYKVLILNYAEKNPVIDSETAEEFLVAVDLIEV